MECHGEYPAFKNNILVHCRFDNQDAKKIFILQYEGCPVSSHATFFCTQTAPTFLEFMLRNHGGDNMSFTVHALTNGEQVVVVKGGGGAELFIDISFQHRVAQCEVQPRGTAL